VSDLQVIGVSVSHVGDDLLAHSGALHATAERIRQLAGRAVQVTRAEGQDAFRAAQVARTLELAAAQCAAAASSLEAASRAAHLFVSRNVATGGSGSPVQPAEPGIDGAPDAAALPAAPTPLVAGPHEAPESWAPQINSEHGLTNCGDCARAVQQTWTGSPRVATLGGPEPQPNPLMVEWSGISPRPISVDGVESTLSELGPGSSAIVGCDWEGGGGHWFNAVNDNGSVKAVDGQSGQVEPWPPSESILGFGAAEMCNVEAIFFDEGGNVVR
jgi:hypothetical protein